MPQPTNENCMNCRYSVVVTDSLMQCRREAPTAHQTGGGDRWADVMPHEWCGRWTPLPTSNMNKTIDHEGRAKKYLEGLLDIIEMGESGDNTIPDLVKEAKNVIETAQKL